MAQDPLTDSSGGNWPVFNRGMTYREIGTSGLRQFGGWVREEFLPQLVGRQAARVYREMGDNSATVGSILFAIIQSIRKVEWTCSPANDTPEAAELAEFADSLRNDMSHTWEDFIAEALSMLRYGFAPHEIVYKKRLGPKPADAEVPGSKFNDGRIGLRRLPIRGQDTVLKWFFDVNGTVKGLTQQPWVGGLVDIPIEKMLLFRPSAHKNNPEGYSILRTAYRPWYFLKRLEEQEAVMLERFSGLPMIKVPIELMEAAAANDPKAMAALEQYQKIVTNVRIDEQMGLVLPSNTYTGGDGNPTSVPQYSFELVSPTGSKGGVNFDVPIQRYKIDIMTSVLADWLTLGHESRGTQSLALSKVDMFFFAIEGWIDSIAAVLNRYLLPRVWALNGLDLALMPQYKAQMPRRTDIDALGTFLLSLTQAGMPLFPDEELENWVREAAGLPDISDHAEGDVTGGEKMPADPASLAKIIKGYGAKRTLRARRG